MQAQAHPQHANANLNVIHFKVLDGEGKRLWYVSIVSQDIGYWALHRLRDKHQHVTTSKKQNQKNWRAHQESLIVYMTALLIKIFAFHTGLENN